MDLFDIEREVSQIERIRIAFLVKNPRHPLHKTYRDVHLEMSGDTATQDEFVQRVISIVGHGVPFLVINGDRVTSYNQRSVEELRLHFN